MNVNRWKQVSAATQCAKNSRTMEPRMEFFETGLFTAGYIELSSREAVATAFDECRSINGWATPTALEVNLI